MNKIIQFHLKIKACNPAWRWMLENERKSPHELWEDCPIGPWLVDYLNKINIDRSLITDATCTHFISLLEKIDMPSTIKQLFFDMTEKVRSHKSIPFVNLVNRPANIQNIFNIFSSVAPFDSEQDIIIHWKYNESNVFVDRAYADAIRKHVPYDLVVAQREKMGG